MGEAVRLGRYTLHAELASGGMATVYLGRLHGAAGFGRTVAVKRLHPHLARDRSFVAMFLDEAHLAVRVQHPNVVSTLDVVSEDGELYLVLEYIDGESVSGVLHAVQDARTKIPLPIAASIVAGALHGLHAAHEAKDEKGTPLAIVHRDVSPQNILVGSDGVARVLDFGVAKAVSRLQTTREGQLKGKLAYMPPEQLAGEVTRKTDIYAAGVVLWEMLTRRRLFQAHSEVHLLNLIANSPILPPSSVEPDVTPEVDAVVLKALARDPTQRYDTAAEMALALEKALRVASPAEVSAWMKENLGERLAAKQRKVAKMEAKGDAGELHSLHSGPRLPHIEDPSASSQVTMLTSAELVTSVSSASVISHVDAKPTPPPRSKARLFALGAGVVALVAVGIAIGLSAGSGDPHTAGAGSSSAAPSVLPSASALSVVAPPPASLSPSAAIPSSTAAPSAPSARGAAKPHPTGTKGDDLKSLIDSRK